MQFVHFCTIKKEKLSFTFLRSLKRITTGNENKIGCSQYQNCKSTATLFSFCLFCIALFYMVKNVFFYM